MLRETRIGLEIWMGLYSVVDNENAAVLILVRLKPFIDMVAGYNVNPDSR